MKKRLLSLMVALLLLGQMAPALAATATPIDYREATVKGSMLDVNSVNVGQFIDWNADAWWAKSGGVQYAVGMGYIVGRDGPSIAPTAEVTEAEFVTVLVRACLTPEAIEEYRQKELREYIDDEMNAALEDGRAVPTAEELTYSFEHGGVNWFKASGCYRAAFDTGLIGGTVINGTDAVTNNCTRAQMATLLRMAMRLRGENIDKLDTFKAMCKMNDSYLFDREGSQYSSVGTAIGTVVAAGIIVGDEAQNFNPGATMTRAEMCEVLLRLDNPTQNGQKPRNTALAKVGLLGQNTVSDTTIVTPNTDPITIDMRNPGKHREPREGDTVIRPDGTSVVLKRDETFGILGWGQNVGPWLGTEVAGLDASGKEYTVDTGHYIAGSDCRDSKWQEDLAGGWYRKCDAPGYEYEYHWSGEWTHIQTETDPNRKGVAGVDGQYDSTGLWMYCADAAIPGWIWQGPDV